MNPEEEKEKAIWRQQKHLEIKNELLTKMDIIHELMPYPYPNAIEEFIDEYAQKKVQWMEWGPQMFEWVEKQDLQWVEDATERLKEIQQKKLFDYQCLWRAEKVTHDELKVTDDFKDWEKKIFSCPFISPITQEDVDIYMQYLQSFNFEHEQGWMDSWQDYEEIKEAYTTGNANRNFPEWYDFHNGRTGLSAYLLLPDIRGKKEEFYLDLWRKERKKEMKKEEEKQKQKIEKQKTDNESATEITDANGNTIDKRPHLDYHKNGWLTWFVNTYEDKTTQEYFFKYGGEHAYDDYDEFLENDLTIMGEADKLIPITGWYDWKEAVHKAAEKYRIEKIMEALPEAYDQYRMWIDTQLPFEQEMDIFKIFGDNGYREAILRGRELNGEPRDFDF